MCGTPQSSVPEVEATGNGQLYSGKCGPDTRHDVDVARQPHGMKWQVECCKPIGISSIITVTKNNVFTTEIYFFLSRNKMRQFYGFSFLA